MALIRASGEAVHGPRRGWSRRAIPFFVLAPVRARRREDWALPDPKHLPPGEFNKVRDEIERRVRQLLGRDIG